MDRCMKTVLLPVIIAALLPYGLFPFQIGVYATYLILVTVPGLYIAQISQISPLQRFDIFGLGSLGGSGLYAYWILYAGVFLILNILIIIQLYRMCKSKQSGKMILILSGISFGYSAVLFILASALFLPFPLAPIVALLRRKAARPLVMSNRLISLNVVEDGLTRSVIQR
jgi:hypothetical protein